MYIYWTSGLVQHFNVERIRMSYESGEDGRYTKSGTRGGGRTSKYFEVVDMEDFEYVRV